MDQGGKCYFGKKGANFSYFLSVGLGLGFFLI